MSTLVGGRWLVVGSRWLVVGGWWFAVDRSSSAACSRIAPMERRDSASTFGSYCKCLLTRLVISNMFTCDLPLKTGLSDASALIIRLFFWSWSPFFLM